MRAVGGILAEYALLLGHRLIGSRNNLAVNHLGVINSDEIAIFHSHLILRPESY